tara:strand:- start:1872 stop:2108 length:237 start_codon:yes stop_codon:yes gene_type:complete
MKQTEINLILAQLKITHQMDQAMDGTHSSEWAMRKFEPLLEVGYSYEDIATYVAIKLQELTIKDESFAKDRPKYNENK